jgi:predicted transcriptional regulator
MVLIHLLANDEKIWIIRVSQLYNKFKKHLGRDSIYKIINEAIEAGYINRSTHTENGMLRYTYYLSESPKFKKTLLFTENQDTGNQETENQDSLERTSKERTSIKKYNKESIPEIVHNSPDPPPKDSISSMDSIPFQRKVKATKAKSQEVDLSSPEVLDLMELESTYLKYFRHEIVVRWIDKFGPAFVLETIRFFLHIKDTQKKPIPNPEAWMESAFVKQYAKVDKTCQENKEFAEKVKKQYSLIDLKINKRYCQNTRTGKDYYYNLPVTTFKQMLSTEYG